MLSSNQQRAACLPGAAEQRRRARAARDVKLSAAADEARRGGDKVTHTTRRSTTPARSVRLQAERRTELRLPVAARPARGDEDTVVRITVNQDDGVADLALKPLPAASRSLIRLL